MSDQLSPLVKKTSRWAFRSQPDGKALGPITAQQPRPWTKYLRAMVSLGLLGWLAWRTDWGRLISAFANLRVEFWVASVALYFATQVVSGLRWQLLARPLGFGGSVWRYTSLYFIGMFFNLMLPSTP